MQRICIYIAWYIRYGPVGLSYTVRLFVTHYYCIESKLHSSLWKKSSTRATWAHGARWRDHRYGAFALRRMHVYAPAFAGTKLYCSAVGWLVGWLGFNGAFNTI